MACLLLLVAGVQSAWAQKVVLHFPSGVPVKYNVSELDSITFEEKTEPSDDWRVVDLDLPSGTLWAACNIGAEDYWDEPGSYFAWGETQPKRNNFYNWYTYAFCSSLDQDGNPTLTKYISNDATELEPEDDAATMSWGSDWQTPSKEQWLELFDIHNTNIYLHDNCLRIASTRNDAWLFLPLGGVWTDTGLIQKNGYGKFGSYWTRQVDDSDISNYKGAFVANFFWRDDVSLNKAVDQILISSRCFGNCIRPVRVEKKTYRPITSIRLNRTTLNLMEGKSAALRATIVPEFATNKTLSWESSDETVATVRGYETSPACSITAVGEGTCVITCRTTDGSNLSAECNVTVEAYPSVDLGLPSGTLWATYNIGADSPEAYGNYYSWGETEPKDNYSWSTYKYAAGTSSTLTKYCTDSNLGNEGFTDGLTELLPEDDVATVKWGSNWQMPSKEQFEELINSEYTTSEVVEPEDGIRGRKITSLINGQSIFFPFSGCRMSTYDPLTVKTYGYYWTRTVSTENKELNDNGYGYCLWMTRNDIYMGVFERKDGATVRPVRKR